MHLNLPFDGSKVSWIPTEFIYKSMKVIKYHIFTVYAKGINLKLKIKHIGLGNNGAVRSCENSNVEVAEQRYIISFSPDGDT